MSPDIKYLVWSGALMLAQVLIYVVGANLKVPLPQLVGNREDLTPPEGWAGRARRAHLNMIESLLPFAIFVIAAALTNKANAMTAMGAMIFFWARLAYAVIYVAGIPWLRTLVWLAGLAGVVMVLLQLL
ncbi:MAG: MAPEG family protein [Pseudomonadota bacterium]|nr:MAPEG family protein [Pseudomonadota bacterium]